MNIVYHHRTLGDGAEGIHIAEMIAAFRALGHDVRVVGPVGEQAGLRSTKKTWLATLKQFFPAFLYEFLELGYNFYGYFLLRREIIKEKPDFIYDRYITFNASSVIVGKRFGVPVFLEVNAPLALERTEQKDERLYLKKIAFSIERWVCNNSFKTIVVSTPLKKYLVHDGVSANKIIVMPNGVNTEKFKPIPKDESLLRKYELHNDCVVIGFVGILRPWHGLDMLLDAFTEVYRQAPHVRLLIVGDGPIRKDLEAQIERNGLGGKVIITGRVMHHVVANYISLFDIAVSPKATFYASPMKILEYMALGKPVVAPDSENIRDIVDENCGGLFANDVISLQDAMSNLVHDRDNLQRLGTNALKLIEYQFQWIKNAERVVAFLGAGN